MRSCHCQLGRRAPGPVPGSLVGSAGATSTMPSTRSGALRNSPRCGTNGLVWRQRGRHEHHAQHALGRPAHRASGASVLQVDAGGQRRRHTDQAQHALGRPAQGKRCCSASGGCWWAARAPQTPGPARARAPCAGQTVLQCFRLMLVGSAGATKTRPSTRLSALHTGLAVLSRFLGFRVSGRHRRHEHQAQHALGRPAHRASSACACTYHVAWPQSEAQTGELRHA